MPNNPIDLGKKDIDPNAFVDPNPPVDPVPPARETPPNPPKKEDEQPKPGEHTPEEKRLYARLKEEEEKNKKYKEKFGDLETPPAPTNPQNPQPVDPFDLASTVAALQGYDQAELKFAQKIAKIDGISPSQAVQTEEFKTFLKGKRGEDYKNNSIPRPNNSAPSTSVKSDEEIAKMSDTEFAAYEKETNASARQNRGI